MSCIYSYKEDIYIGLQSGDVKHLDLSGNVLNTFTNVLQESSIPHSMIFLWNQLFVGCRDGYLLVIDETKTSKKIGDKPISLFPHLSGLIVVSDSAIFVYNRDLDYKVIEIDMRNGCSLNETSFVSINFDIQIVSIDNLNPYSLNQTTIKKFEKVIKNLLYVKRLDSIFFTCDESYGDVINDLKMADYSTSLSFKAPGKIHCIIEVPFYNAILIGGEKEDGKGYILFLNISDFTEIYKAYFPHGVHALSIFKNDKLVIGAEEFIFLLQLIDFTEQNPDLKCITTTRVRNSVVKIQSDTDIYVADSRDGIIHYLFDENELKFQFCAFNGGLISNFLEIDDLIIQIDKEGKIEIYDKESKKRLAYYHIKDGAKAIIHCNLLKYSLTSSNITGVLILS